MDLDAQGMSRGGDFIGFGCPGNGFACIRTPGGGFETAKWIWTPAGVDLDGPGWIWMSEGVISGSRWETHKKMKEI